MRIVSLLPSATEIVHALGAGQELVGRSEECDFPPEVRSLPVVMRATTLDADRPSADIDRRVRDSLERGESLYRLDLDLLRSLRPDVLLTQDLCRVCSVTEEEVAVACREAGLAPTVVSLAPRRLTEVVDSFAQVAEAIGRPEAGAALVRSSRDRIGPAPPVSDTGPRVAVVEWLDPPILAGLWTPDLVAVAGGRSIGPPAGANGLRTTWDHLRVARPDLVVLSPCSFSVARTRKELAQLPTRGKLTELAPPLGVVLADEAYFSRPGPRLLDGVGLIRRLVGGEPPEGPMPVERWLSAPAA